MGIGVKVHTGKVIHNWVREGGGALVLNINYLFIIYILLNIFVMFNIVGSSPRLRSHPVVFSLVVHFYYI